MIAYNKKTGKPDSICAACSGKECLKCSHASKTCETANPGDRFFQSQTISG